MAWRVKIESLTVVCRGFLEILRVSKLLKATQNKDGKVMQGSGAIWMARGVKIESLMIACNGVLEILHLSQEFKTG
jgi:hypothetical protein